MLLRVLEPEVMDSREEAHDYDDMDHSEVNRVFVRDLLLAANDLLTEHRLKLDAGEEVRDLEVVDLGTGTAQIPIELCRLTENLRVVGCDLATNMLDLAIMNIDIAQFRHRISLSHCDAKDLPHQDERFPIVMSNSIVHHIPEPLMALREGVRVLAPNGVIFIRDLLRPENDGEVERLVETYAQGCNDHQRAMFDASLRAAFRLDEVREMVNSLGFPAHEVQATSDRHWTWCGRRTAIVSA